MKKSAFLLDELKQRLAVDALAATAGGGLGYLSSYLSGSPEPAWSGLMGVLMGLGAGEARQLIQKAPKSGQPGSLKNRIWTNRYDSLRGNPPFSQNFTSQ